MAGDRIVMVNDSLFAGKGLTNEKAMRNLKGPKGSQVKLGVKRATEKELLDFTITRGDIPQTPLTQPICSTMTTDIYKSANSDVPHTWSC